MAETTTQVNANTPVSTGTSSRGLQASSSREIEASTDQGKTTIADGVVAKIVGIATREIEGIHDLVATGAGATISGLATRVTGGDTRASGVSVEVGEKEAAVDLTVVVEYGVSIPQVANAVRRNIINRVGAMTGLTVKEINIAVTDMYFPQDQTVQQPQQPRVQ